MGTSAPSRIPSEHKHSVLLRYIGYTGNEIHGMAGIEQLSDNTISEHIKQKVVSNIINNGNRQNAVRQKEIE